MAEGELGTAIRSVQGEDPVAEHNADGVTCIPDIPEGYSYTRCDRYKADEFVKKHRKTYTKEVCEEYIREHPKEFYDTDDEIAMHLLVERRRINGLARHTTKRYREDASNR